MQEKAKPQLPAPQITGQYGIILFLPHLKLVCIPPVVRTGIELDFHFLTAGPCGSFLHHMLCSFSPTSVLLTARRRLPVLLYLAPG